MMLVWGHMWHMFLIIETLNLSISFGMSDWNVDIKIYGWCSLGREGVWMDLLITLCKVMSNWFCLYLSNIVCLLTLFLIFDCISYANLLLCFVFVFQYGLPLKVVSYKDLYGWTMDEIVKMIGLKNNCTFCGVFRRQVWDYIVCIQTFLSLSVVGCTLVLSVSKDWSL